MNIAILIPAHNEARTIHQLVVDVVKQGFDVYVVDDGSSDGTGLIAAQAGAIVMSTGSKSGKGAALRRGLEQILKGNYEAVIFMDGDGQHDPSDLPNFVQAFASKRPALINGNRMQAVANMPWLRLMTNRFMSWLISSICGQYIADTQCGYRLVSTSALRQMHFRSKSFEIETEMLIKAAKQHLTMMDVPIKTIYADEVSKISPLKDTLRFVRFLWRELWQK